MIYHHLVVFIQHDPGELRELKSWTFAKIEPPVQSEPTPGLRPSVRVCVGSELTRCVHNTMVRIVERIYGAQ
jgi:hypothetical protein